MSYTPGVENGLLHYRALKSCKNKALSRNKFNFYENMTLTSGDLVDIQWLIDNVRHEFTQLIKMGPQVNVSTDSSSFCMGGGGGAFSGDSKTGGPLDMTKQSPQINTLGMKAVLLGLQALCDNVRDSHIRVI